MSPQITKKWSKSFTPIGTDLFFFCILLVFVARFNFFSILVVLGSILEPFGTHFECFWDGVGEDLSKSSIEWEGFGERKRVNFNFEIGATKTNQLQYRKSPNENE